MNNKKWYAPYNQINPYIFSRPPPPHNLCVTDDADSPVLIRRNLHRAKSFRSTTIPPIKNSTWSWLVGAFHSFHSFHSISSTFHSIAYIMEVHWRMRCNHYCQVRNYDLVFKVIWYKPPWRIGKQLAKHDGNPRSSPCTPGLFLFTKYFIIKSEFLIIYLSLLA